MKFRGSPNSTVLAACLLGMAVFRADGWEHRSRSAPSNRAPTSGFVVDGSDRNDVLAFWHAIYMASEGYDQRVGWTGDYNGRPGNTSPVFAADVERRLNYFRAMCGVPADARVNANALVAVDATDSFKPAPTTPKVAAAQAAAVMLIRSYNPATGQAPGMTHDPPQSLPGWTPAVWNASAKGNLAFGLYGPGAITEYMVEELAAGSATSFWNSWVGHRRWNLDPQATQFGSGDQPGQSATRPPTNVFYVIQRTEELRTLPAAPFVSYPPPGFFPAPINSRFWSLSHKAASFANASVSVTDSNGREVPVSNIKRDGNFGGPAVVWQVAGAAAAKSVLSDTSFRVRVSGIVVDGVPTSHSYTVTLIHPDRLTSDQRIKGPARVAANAAVKYRFQGPSRAENLQVTTFRRLAARWSEGAESSPKARILDGTSKTYPLIVAAGNFSGFGVVSGTRAFRLTFPTTYDLLKRGVPEQSFELDREILPKPGGKLKFFYQRGFMTRGSNLVAEYSANGGLSWKALGKPITGVSDTAPDAKVSEALLPLPKSSQPLRVRFRYFTRPGVSIYTHEAAPKAPTGIFIDEISFENCDWLEPRKHHRLKPTMRAFTFDRKSAGAPLREGDQWLVAMKTQLGGKWFPYGPMKKISVTSR
jgi:hypothetical protein